MSNRAGVDLAASRIAAPFAWTVAAVAVLLGAATLWLSGRNGGLSDQVGFMLPFLTFPPIAAILASRRPHNPLGWILLAIPVCSFIYAGGQQYALYGLATAPGAVPAAAFVAWARLSMWVPSAVLFLVWLPLLYPTGRALSRRWAATGWLPTTLMAAAVIVVQVTSWPARGTALLELGSADVELHTAADAVFTVAFPFLLLGAIASWSSLVVRYRRGSTSERLQLRWLAFALAAFLVGHLSSMAFPDSALSKLAPGVAVPLVPAAIAVAVLRYRLYEIDRIVSRTVGYVLVTAILVGLYLGLVVALGAVARAVTGESGDLVVALSTLAVAAVFQPVRQRVRSAVDRRFNRSRYDAARTVEAFGVRLRDHVDLDALHAELTAVVARTVHPMHASVWRGKAAT